MTRATCPRCQGRLYSDRGAPFCFACGTLREWPEPRAYRENPQAPSLRRRRPVTTTPRGGRPWTPDEDRFLEEHRHDMSLAEIADALGRTVRGVQTHLDLVLNLPKPYVRRPAGVGSTCAHRD